MSRQRRFVKAARSLVPLSMIQSDIPVVKSEDDRTVRMIGPPLGMETIEDVIAISEIEYDTCHI
jgi:hypothetical protein